MLSIPLLALVPAFFPQVAKLEELPLLVLTEDDTQISQSTRVRIPAGALIRDRNGNGVLHIVGDQVRVVFEAGSVLCGAGPQEDPDSFTGVGLRVVEQSGVSIEGLQVRGYKTGIYGTQCHGLQLSKVDVSDNFTERLASTPEACDDGADWLGCHDNDAGEWRGRYGAGIYIEDSRGIVVRDCRGRRTQNGLLLDRVTGAQVFDNDFSFLSGWGLGLWRSSENVISRNAFDFCIRGYSHGVYNRGQDSAGILVFEQCSRNVFAGNSATHGGDGVFGFAGSEALGQRKPLPAGFDATGLGNNGNLFVGNDFSYAAAHGLEMTFSFDNVILSNRFEGNGICGIWGGYSQSTLIAKNHFEANGDAGYGKERGGINIEHSVNNRILENEFLRNACGVHLWWDADEGLLATPWAQANETGCTGNELIGNQFTEDVVAVELRACQPVLVVGNRMQDVGTEFAAQEGALTETPASQFGPLPQPEANYPGKRQPVGARRELAGRENIVMGTWGPWDHESPFLQSLLRNAEGHTFALHNFPDTLTPVLTGPGLQLEQLPGTPARLRLSAKAEGLFPYELRVGSSVLNGVLQRMSWSVATFAFDEDPRTSEEAWGKAARAATAQIRSSLDLPYASGGPAHLGFAALPAERTNHFGTFAQARVNLPPGTYEIQTMSDDGLRVWVDDKPVIDNWTWHAPTAETARFQVDVERKVSLRVEHFELDGYATLQVSLHPVR